MIGDLWNPLNLEKMNRQILFNKEKCLSCGEEIRTRARKHPHKNGIYVKGNKKPQRIYYTCKCGHKNSLVKLAQRANREKERGER